MNLALVATAVMGLVPLPPKPVSPERLQELIKKLEEPRPSSRDGSGEPPKGAPPARGFRLNGEAIKELERAGSAAIAPLISLYEDYTKPSQARSQAAWVLSAHLIGHLSTPDPRVINTVRKAIRDKDPAVRENVLMSFHRIGVNFHRRSSGWNTAQQGISLIALKAILPDVLASISDEDPGISINAIGALYEFGVKGVGIKELLGALTRKEIAIQITAVQSLGEVGTGDEHVLSTLELLVIQNDLRLSMAFLGTSPIQTALTLPPSHQYLREESQVAPAIPGRDVTRYGVMFF